MTSHKLRAFHSISVDPYDKSYFELSGASVARINSLPVSNQYNYISYVASKDLIVGIVNLNFSVSKDDLDGAIEDIAFEELGLNPELEYVIKYWKKKDGRYQVLAIQNDKLDALFSARVEEIGYIDSIIPAPLVFTSLYSDILDSRGVHCFLYFMRADAFISFYKNGQYIYSKSIGYSLDNIYAKYVESGGLSMSQESFFEHLAGNGSKDSDFQTRIMRIFGAAFISFNDVLVYARRIHGLDVIDRLYIGSSAGSVAGLSNFSQNYFGLKSYEMHFDFGYYDQNNSTDQFTKMLFAINTKGTSKSEINLTQYHRPPPMYKRSSGQLIASVIIASIIGILPSLYYLVSKVVVDGQISMLSLKESELIEDAAKYKMLFEKKSLELNNTATRANSMRESLDAKEKTLVAIYDKKVNYQPKSKQYVEFAKDFDKFNIKSYNLKSFNDNYYLFLVAQQDSDITKFISYVSKKYNNSASLVDISMIARDENSGTYQGLLRVDFK